MEVPIVGLYVNRSGVTIEVRPHPTYSVGNYQCRSTIGEDRWHTIRPWEIKTLTESGNWRPHALSVAPGL